MDDIIKYLNSLIKKTFNSFLDYENEIIFLRKSRIEYCLRLKLDDEKKLHKHIPGIMDIDGYWRNFYLNFKLNPLLKNPNFNIIETVYKSGVKCEQSLKKTNDCVITNYNINHNHNFPLNVPFTKNILNIEDDLPFQRRNLNCNVFNTFNLNCALSNCMHYDNTAFNVYGGYGLRTDNTYLFIDFPLTYVYHQNLNIGYYPKEELLLTTMENNLKIGNKPFEPIYIAPNSPWQKSDALVNSDQNLEHYGNFKDEKGRVILQICKYYHYEKELYIPATNYIRTDFLNPSIFYMMHLTDNHPLYNLDIIATIDRPILLTANLQDAVRFSSIRGCRILPPPVTWSSWYGGVDAVKYLDLKPLRNKKVYYYYRFGNIHDIKIAMKLLNKIESLKGVKLEFICNTQIKHYCLNRYDFLKECHKSSDFQLNSKYKDLLDNFCSIADIKVKEPEFVINPIITKNSLTVIFAASGVGKTWLGITIGIAISKGMDVFKHWKTNENRGVIYLFGEMDKEEIHNRLDLINRMYIKNEDNFMFTRVSNKDISKDEDQAYVEMLIQFFEEKMKKKFSVLILDNLISLAEKAIHQAGWDRLFNWIESLKKRGITVIIVHHSNRQGKFLGAGNIINKSDCMIEVKNVDEKFLTDFFVKNLGLLKAVKMGKDDAKNLLSLIEKKFLDSLAMYIQYKKLRSVEHYKGEPFFIKLLTGQRVGWEVNFESDLMLLSPEDIDISNMHEKEFINLTLQEQKTIIIQLYEDHLTQKEMSEKLNIPLRTLTQIMEKTKTRKKDFKNKTTDYLEYGNKKYFFDDFNK